MVDPKNPHKTYLAASVRIPSDGGTPAYPATLTLPQTIIHECSRMSSLQR
jgi:hypothetical protein